jgi:hypothetical protein
MSIRMKLLSSSGFLAGLCSAWLLSWDAEASGQCDATINCPNGGSATCRTPPNVHNPMCGQTGGSQVQCTWQAPCAPGGSMCTYTSEGNCS